MSKKTVLAFIHQVTLNPELQARLQNASDFGSLQGIASSQGYSFTEEEWNIASAEAFYGLLSEEDLEEVNGGLTSTVLQGKALVGLSGGYTGGFSGKSGSLN
jgi:predicted ribosomally synthesized peptide with nif11-like leader